MLKACLRGKTRLGAVIGVGCSLSLLFVGSALAAPSTSHLAARKWLSANAKTKNATLTLISAYNNANSGYNFDGYAKGKMVVTVPLGWHVHVKCLTSSKATVNHSCAITKKLSATKPAFPHAASKDPQSGVTPGSKNLFTFVPTKVGTYRILCLVPGHEQAGMWDILKVVKSGTAKITLK